MPEREVQAFGESLSLSDPHSQSTKQPFMFSWPPMARATSLGKFAVRPPARHLLKAVTFCSDIKTLQKGAVLNRARQQYEGITVASPQRTCRWLKMPQTAHFRLSAGRGQGSDIMGGITGSRLI
jgi:hypothetical protein